MTALSAQRLREPFFHYCANLLKAGSVILPGNFGRIIFSAGGRHPLLMREFACEHARIEVQQNAPSRLRCAYAFLTLEEAFHFRQELGKAPRQGFEFHNLYQVRLEDPDAAHFVADMQLVRDEGAEIWSRQYWQGASADDANVARQFSDLNTFEIPCREFLTMSPLIVEELISRG